MQSPGIVSGLWGTYPNDLEKQDYEPACTILEKTPMSVPFRDSQHFCVLQKSEKSMFPDASHGPD